MSLEFVVSDLSRRLANIIRFGTIEELDVEKARVKVKTCGLVTDWLPWLTTRAGEDVSWWSPTKGEQVVVLSPSGEMAIGVVIPAIYSNDYPANETNASIHKITYSDGTVFEYDRENSKATLNCVGDVELTAGSIKITGDVSIEGALSTSGNITASGDVVGRGISLSGHKHSGVKPGPSMTGGPV